MKHGIRRLLCAALVLLLLTGTALEDLGSPAESLSPLASAVETSGPNPEPATSMDLEILPAPDAIRFEVDSLHLGLGQLQPLKFSVEPEGAVGAYSYASSDAKIVRIGPDGILAGMAIGSAQITATAHNGTSATLNVTVVPYSDANPVFSVAHRGASGYCPDNSLAAFRRAAELGADMVELDVRRTLDGQIVVFHDSKINYNGRKYAISSLTMDAIRRANPDVCSLAEALECIAESDMEVIIEFKVAGIEAEVLEHVDKCSLQGRTKYGSFTLSVINKVKALRPSAETVYITNNKNTLNAVVKSPDKYSASIISASSSILNPTTIYKLHLAGKAVVAWTINAPSEIARFTAMGVDGIITNFPDYV